MLDSFIGTKLLGYTILREIGEGGMGKVYLAENQMIGQQVAIKILDPILARNPDLRERFAQEARIQVALQHQNIVRVLNAQSSEELSFLIMEYIDGQSLDKVLKRRGKLSVDESIKIFSQVLDGVGYAHDKGVIHRDLKPSNIMVCADGTTKVTDFGIAKVLGDTKLTRTGTSMGSPDYMSPEQVLGKKDIDHRTDIYSLGATLYEMLTGRPPFVIENGGAADSDFLVKQAHLKNLPIQPHRLDMSIGLSLSYAVLTAMGKDPKSRLPTCNDFLSRLSPSKKQNARYEPNKASSVDQIDSDFPSSSISDEKDARLASAAQDLERFINLLTKCERWTASSRLQMRAEESVLTVKVNPFRGHLLVKWIPERTRDITWELEARYEITHMIYDKYAFPDSRHDPAIFIEIMKISVSGSDHDDLITSANEKLMKSRSAAEFLMTTKILKDDSEASQDELNEILTCRYNLEETDFHLFLQSKSEGHNDKVAETICSLVNKLDNELNNASKYYCEILSVFEPVCLSSKFKYSSESIFTDELRLVNSDRKAKLFLNKGSRIIDIEWKPNDRLSYFSRLEYRFEERGVCFRTIAFVIDLGTRIELIKDNEILCAKVPFKFDESSKLKSSYVLEEDHHGLRPSTIFRINECLREQTYWRVCDTIDVKFFIMISHAEIFSKDFVISEISAEIEDLKLNYSNFEQLVADFGGVNINDQTGEYITWHVSDDFDEPDRDSIAESFVYWSRNRGIDLSKIYLFYKLNAALQKWQNRYE